MKIASVLRTRPAGDLRSYANPQGNFVFASEIKALFAFPVREGPDDQAAVGFLVHGTVTLRTDAVSRIQALPAAHSLTVDGTTGRIAIRRYWTLEPQQSCHQSDAEKSRCCGDTH